MYPLLYIFKELARPGLSCHGKEQAKESHSEYPLKFSYIDQQATVLSNSAVGVLNKSQSKIQIHKSHQQICCFSRSIRTQEAESLKMNPR